MNDRERLKRLVFNAWLDTATENDGVATAAQIAGHLIANGVTVQKQGRWEFKGTAYACSECGTGFPAPVSYCFGCGAKMDETDSRGSEAAPE